MFDFLEKKIEKIFSKKIFSDKVFDFTKIDEIKVENKKSNNEKFLASTVNEVYEKYYNFDKNIYQDFLIAVLIYRKFSLVLDSLMDEDFNRESKLLRLAFISQFEEESIKILARLFEKESVFWNYFFEKKDEYFKVPILEKNTKNFNDYLTLGKAKTSLEKVAFFGLKVLSGKGGQEDVFPEIEKIIDYLNLGMHLQDDLLDFGKDLSENRFNYYKMFLGENEYNQTSKEKINQIKTKLYTEGYAIKGLEQSIGFFEKGKAISEKINLKEFTKKADYGIIKSKENIKIIKGYLDESK